MGNCQCFGFIYNALWSLLSFSFRFCWPNQHTHEFLTNKHAYALPIEDVHFLLASVVVTLFDAVIETSLYEAWLKLLTKVSSVPFLIQVNLPYLNYIRTSRVVSHFGLDNPKKNDIKNSDERANHIDCKKITDPKQQLSCTWYFTKSTESHL